jgi:hypothetical protein
MSEVAYEGWALVEQMGFRRTVAKVREVEMFGTKMLRMDVPIGDTLDGEFTTRFAGGPSLYQVTPLSDEVALDSVKRQGDPRPVKPTSYQVEDHSDDDYEERI